MLLSKIQLEKIMMFNKLEESIYYNYINFNGG